MSYFISLLMRPKLVRFALNWNVGILERWNNGLPWCDLIGLEYCWPHFQI